MQVTRNWSGRNSRSGRESAFQHNQSALILTLCNIFQAAFLVTVSQMAKQFPRVPSFQFVVLVGE